MSYITYECTVCRRTKSFIRDNQRVVPNQCVITKGCLGRLAPLSESQEASSTPAIAGVADWYPRGENKTTAEVSTASQSILMSNSSSGALVIAVKSSDPASLPIQITLDVEQKKIGDVGFQQFTFKATAATTSISGRDLNGKNLRFDQLAIDEQRVVVRLNGVEISPVLEPSKVIFNFPASSSVDVIVFNDVDVTKKTIFATRNKSLIPSLTKGSWSNIDYVTRVLDDGTLTKWYLYTADTIGDMTAGKIKVYTGNGAVFLLSSTPYQSMDRYLSFIIPQEKLQDDFLISPVDGHFTISKDLVDEIYPPFAIPLDSYIVSDLYTVASSSAIVTDTELVRLPSSKILGPT